MTIGHWKRPKNQHHEKKKFNALRTADRRHSGFPCPSGVRRCPGFHVCRQYRERRICRMKTSPAFQFYPADFIAGTAHMSAQEVGGYIRLLCHQWQQGSIPSDEVQVSRIAGIRNTKLSLLLTKFVKGTDGNLRNPRMESIRQKIEVYREKQAEHGKTGGRPKANPEKGSLSKPFVEPNPNESSHTHTHTHTSPNGEVPQTPKSNILLEPPESEPPASPSLRGKGITEGKASTNLPTTDQSKRFAGIAKRKLTTPWSEKEIAKYKKLGVIDEADLLAVETYYAAPTVGDRDIRRRDLGTLINNWPGEVDRAKRFAESQEDDRPTGL